MLSKEHRILMILVAAFISLLVISNIIAVKTITVGGLIGPAAVLCYSLTFVISDTISELWGRKTTQFVINTGFGAAILSALFIKLAIVMPGSPFWQQQEAFETILGSNIRIVIASLAALLHKSKS
ncbi:MAG: queuosine precursor transporter [Bacteroidales bacterium]|nr:queuosine precursor transporter [Bacteroidales bacterium]